MWSKEEKKTQDSERIINSEFELQFERAILWSDPLPTSIWTGTSHKTLLQMKCSVVLLLHHMFVLPYHYGMTLNPNLAWKSQILSQPLPQRSSHHNKPQLPSVFWHGSGLPPEPIYQRALFPYFFLPSPRASITSTFAMMFVVLVLPQVFRPTELHFSAKHPPLREPTLSHNTPWLCSHPPSVAPAFWVYFALNFPGSFY